MMDIIEDEKLKYLTGELYKFMQYFIANGEKYGDKVSMNYLELSKSVGSFYDKHGSRYNKNQLVNQYIKLHLGLEMVKEYSKVKSHLDDVFKNTVK